MTHVDSALNPEEALLAPLLAPGVDCDPEVWDAMIGTTEAPAYQLHGVIMPCVQLVRVGALVALHRLSPASLSPGIFHHRT